MFLFQAGFYIPLTLTVVIGGLVATLRYFHDELRNKNELFRVIPTWLLLRALVEPELKARLTSAYWEHYTEVDPDYREVARIAFKHYQDVLRRRRAELIPFSERYYASRRDEQR